MRIGLAVFLMCLSAASSSDERVIRTPIETAKSGAGPWFDMQAARNGLIWFASADGVMAYDGQVFSPLQQNDTSSARIRGLSFALAESPDGILWAAGADGQLFAFHPESANIDSWNDRIQQAFGDVGRFLHASWSGEHLLLLSDSHLIAVHPGRQQVLGLRLPAGRNAALGALVVNGAQVWLQLADARLRQLHIGDTSLSLQDEPQTWWRVLPLSSASSLGVREDGQLFRMQSAAHTDLGVRIPLASGERLVSAAPWGSKAAVLLTSRQLWLWEADAAELTALHFADQNVESMNALQLLGSGLQGEFWLVQSNRQLYYLPARNGVRLLTPDAQTEAINGVQALADGQLLVAAAGGLMTVNGPDNLWNSDLGSDPGFHVERVHQQSRQTWLFGNRQVTQYKRAGAPAIALPDSAGRPALPLAAIEIGKDWWIASLHAGLVHVKDANSPNPTVRPVVPDRAFNGFAPIGAQEWLAYGLEGSMLLLTPYGPDAEAAIPSLPTHEIYLHHQDAWGRLWLLTGNGAHLIQRTHADRFSVESHLSSDSGQQQAILCWLPLTQDQVLAATPSALLLYQISTRQTRNLSDHPALKQSVTPGSCAQLPDGRIAIGTRAGLLVFPVQQPSPPLPPKVVLRTIEQNERVMTLFHTDSVPTIRARYEQRYLNLRFAVLPALPGSQHRYQFAIDDQAWRDFGLRSEIQLGQIDAGKHLIQVRAVSGTAGQWQTDPLHISVLIEPPVWRHPLAYLAYALILLTLSIQIWRQQRWKLMTLRNHVSALNASEQRLLSALWASRNSYWEYDLTRKVWSRSPLDFLGYGSKAFAEAGPLALATIIHPSDANTVQQQWAQIVRGERTGAFQHEYRMRHHSGDWHWVQERGHAVRLDAEQRPLAYAGTLHDIQAQKDLENELRELSEELEMRVMLRTRQLQGANRELEAFTASVTHDLKAPLRRMSSFLDMLQEEYAQQIPTGAQAFLSRAKNQAEHMRSLIDDLMRLSQVSQQAMRHTSVDISAQAKELCELYQQQYPQQHYQIDIAPKLVADGDAGLIRTLMQNLLENAFKYSQYVDAPEIRVYSTRDSDCTVFRVQDNGVGFEVDNATDLFQPFRRFHSGNQFQGSGIGLSTARRIVERHDGDIWLQSQPGKGTTACFSLGCHAQSHLCRMREEAFVVE